MISLLKRWWEGRTSKADESFHFDGNPFEFQDSACFGGADITQIRQRVQEARGWFLQYEGRPQAIPLWSDELRPTGSPPEAVTTWLPSESDPADLNSLIEEVCNKRTNLAPANQLYPEFEWPKALLVFVIHDSLSCGGAHVYSKLLNWDNLPAWETWLYVHTSPKKGPQLLCFIPDELMNEVDEAVGHNPEACVFWVNPAEVFGGAN